MSPATPEFLMGVENECLTAVAGTDDSGAVLQAIEDFLNRAAKVAPSVRGGGGLFNAYGRVYQDTNLHLEFASSECDSPYLLPRVIEQQQLVAREAVKRLKREKRYRLILANNNHSGLYRRSDTATWGAHSNYLVEVHPSDFGDQILPFLVTRNYAGAGVVESPSGRFLFSARGHAMRHATGGGTTECRAIHSTSREESLMNCDPPRFRYHLICGDGHRSHYNLALQAGATLLAVKAVIHNPRLHLKLPEFRRPSEKWTTTLRRFNVMAKPGEAPRVPRAVIDVQRVYLDGALDFAHSLSRPPDWIERTLIDWDETLRAMERGDNDWLSQRLDAWIKFKLFSQILAMDGRTTASLRNNEPLQAELALLNQQYHEFTDANSPFEMLQQQGLIDHRVGPMVPPGGEKEPYVPDTGTRAAARARFIKEAAQNGFLGRVDWSYVVDDANQRMRQLDEPMAQSYSPWQNLAGGEEDDESLTEVFERLRLRWRTRRMLRE